MIEESKRADKKKNQSEVVKALIKEPTLTERELAKKTGLSNWTAHNHKIELEQNWAKSTILDKVLEMDDHIMDLSNQITLQKIMEEAPKDEEGNIIVSSLSLSDVKMIWDLANNSTKRKAIFWEGNKDSKVQFIIG